MKISHDSNTDRWIGEHDTYPIMVSGPTKKGVIARLDEFAIRYANSVALTGAGTGLTLRNLKNCPCA